MTEPIALHPDGGDGGAAATHEVEALLATLSKALRAFIMYQANNPVFQRFQASLQEGFEAVWQKTDRLALGVRETGFEYAGEVFVVGRGRDSLAFAFFKDGVRELVFLPGFEAEVGAFLEAVTRAQKNEADADDLISVLWERDFTSLEYRYVDLLTEGVTVPTAPDGAPAAVEGLSVGEDLAADAESADAEEGEEATDGGGSEDGGLSREDFDDTLYFLDQGEMATLQTEVQIEMERDLRTDVLKALFDRLEDGAGRPGRQAEILDILDQLLPLFLSRGEMKSAGQILEELDRLQSREGADPALVERTEQLFKRLSDPQVLEQFVQALEDGAVSPESDEVSLFFSRLHAEALPVLIRFSEMSETPGVRDRLASAIDGLATRYPAEVNRLLASDEAALVRGAAAAAGRVGVAQAVAGLQAALRHNDAGVRLVVVEALVAIRLTPALQALTLALEDEDRDVRIAAARALGTVRFASARDALLAAIEHRRLRDADLTEKRAFFEAYGAVGGSSAVERLDGILNDKGFLGRRAATEMRACAALGLSVAGTAAARAALEKARGDDDGVVRNAVAQALKQEVEAP